MIISTEISFVLVKALQEQNEIIKNLQTQLSDLQKQITPTEKKNGTNIL